MRSPQRSPLQGTGRSALASGADERGRRGDPVAGGNCEARVRSQPEDVVVRRARAPVTPAATSRARAMSRATSAKGSWSSRPARNVGSRTVPALKEFVVEHALGVLLEREPDRRHEREEPEGRPRASADPGVDAACEAQDGERDAERADQRGVEVAVAGRLQQVVAALGVGLGDPVGEPMRNQAAGGRQAEREHPRQSVSGPGHGHLSGRRGISRRAAALPCPHRIFPQAVDAT